MLQNLADNRSSSIYRPAFIAVVHPSAPSPVPPATIHLDLDGAAQIYQGHGWPHPYADDALFESGMRNFLDFFESNSIRVTLFVIANSLEDPRKRALVEAAVGRGHEIASHSLTHGYLPALDSAGKRREIGESKAVLERELGIRVRGFRAPGYRIDRASFELLAEYGYEYDASAWPNARWARMLATSVDVLRAPHRPVEGSDFVEWPMPEYAPSPVPFNPSHSLLFGNGYFRWSLERYRERARPLVMLFHLIDLAEPMPAARLRGLSSRIFTLSIRSAASKRVRCQAMLDLVRTHFRIAPTLDVIGEWRSAGRIAQGAVA